MAMVDNLTGNKVSMEPDVPSGGHDVKSFHKWNRGKFCFLALVPGTISVPGLEQVNE